MAVFPIFDLKWDITAYSTLTAEWKEAATNGMNRTGIQLSFVTVFIPVSLILEFVFPTLKQKFASGDPLVAGFESRPRQHFSWEREANFSHRRGPLEDDLSVMSWNDYICVYTLSLGISKVILRY